ncbi:hypothetical protein ACWGTO_33320, partial [Mesorhizobium sp. PL10]
RRLVLPILRDPAGLDVVLLFRQSATHQETALRTTFRISTCRLVQQPNGCRLNSVKKGLDRGFATRQRHLAKTP